jgi:PKD repeat protein
VTESSGSGTCTGAHTFTTPGVYSVTVTVTDDDTGAQTKPLDLQYIVVFDPDAGFVTGGGWIMSPAGACQLTAACVNQIGKANFGFVSKYKKGSNTPDGQTEFQFQAGDINFHSASYDVGSLVVSGYKAQYKGTGDINGVQGYKFVLTAYDGDVNGGGGVDKFRMKITKNGVVVYDNRVGASDDIDLANPTAIGGGSIVIHK